MLSNKVSEIMTTEILSAEADTRAYDVIQAMIARNVGRIIIIKDDLPVGIFTERHVLKHVAGNKLDAHRTPVENIMTAPFRAVSADTHIIDALGVMLKERIRHLQVLGPRENIVGIVSMRRILELAVELGRELTEDKTVGRLISCPALVMDQTKTVSDAIESMIRNGTGAIVITDRDVPVGIFTERDVLNRVVGKGLDATCPALKEVMTAPLITMPDHALIGQVLDQMYRRDIRNMPVINEFGGLTGLIAMPDILQFARAFDIDETVRKTWKEIKNFYDSQDEYTPG